MMTFVIYLLKSIACSGILYAFYRIFYYNRPHHQWSRFYLLLSVIISVVLPLVQIELPVFTSEQPSAVVQLLNVVATDKAETEDKSIIANNSFDTGSLLLILYVAASCVCLYLLIISLLRILNIYNTHPKQKLNNIQTVMTQEKDTPFSFLRIIFWNTSINYDSLVGEKIFQHEQVHVQQLHSIDRLFINAVLTVFWCNPFYWLIKKEMIVVHEFMADRKSISDRNPETLSEMMLLSAYPGQNFGVTSSFFNSSIKRRLAMLTTLNNSKIGFLGKWLLVPVVVLLLPAFTLRKTHTVNGPLTPFTVIIDAGHGGETSGAVAPDGTLEKDLNLLIAQKIRDLNKDANIRVVMTRDNDAETPLRERVTIANNAKADAFISIHINRDPSGQSGIQLYMTKNSTPYATKSQMLGSLLSEELKKIYKIDGDLRKGRGDQGIWVLDAPEIKYPSLIVECGNMMNNDDLAFVKSSANQEKIAQQILNAIKMFAATKTSLAPQRTPNAIEILVENGNVNFELEDNKIVKSDLSTLTMASTKIIFAGDDFKADGRETVFVDGIHLSDKNEKTGHLSIGKKQKIILVSTKGLDPLGTLVN